MENNIIAPKSVLFAIRIVKAYQFLTENKKEYVLSKQLLRSGTAIGALIKEAVHAESDADYLHKKSIALKEANETTYWLLLLKEANYLSEKEYDSLYSNAIELVRLLAGIVKTLKQRIATKKLITK